MSVALPPTPLPPPTPNPVSTMKERERGGGLVIILKKSICLGMQRGKLLPLLMHQ